MATESGTRHLGIKAATLYAWIYREKIQAFKIRGRWQLNRDYIVSSKREAGEYREKIEASRWRSK